MITFLIQTINNEVVHDFSFSLLEAIRYDKWYHGIGNYSAALTEDWEEFSKMHFPNGVYTFVPIGTVEFFLEHIQKRYDDKTIKPLNIPRQLMKPEYLKRWVMVGDNKFETNAADKLFVKCNNVIKSSINGIYASPKLLPDGEYLFSELVDIDSEWRGFVHNGVLVGLNNYSGDFDKFPDVDLIREMIKEFGYKLPYTIDVGINKNGTFIVECHDFFSCGLYGFANLSLLPRMFADSWKGLILND